MLPNYSMVEIRKTSLYKDQYKWIMMLSLQIVLFKLFEKVYELYILSVYGCVLVFLHPLH